MSDPFKILRQSHQGRDTVAVRWGKDGDHYALTHLAAEGGQIRPAGERRLLTPQGLLAHPRTLVFGERSGGGRSLLEWLRQDSNVPWISARGYRWGAEHFQFSECLDAQVQTLTEGLLGFATGTAAERSQHLMGLARVIDQPLHLLIRDLGGLGPESAEEAAQALRLFGEATEQEDMLQKLHVLIVSTSENRYEDRFDASGFAIMCERYRLPWLEPAEVTGMVQDRLFETVHGSPLTLDGDALDELVQATGGQPLLVTEFLVRMASMGPEASKRDIKKAYRHFRDQPPSAARWWKTDLQARLDDDSGLVDVLRNYVSGYSHAGETLPKPQHALMYSGWIRFDRSIQRWKIASRIHKHLAYEVLTERLER